MTIQEAITERHSVRQYTTEPIEAEKISAIETEINRCNQNRFE